MSNLRMIDLLRLLAGAISHPGNDENDKFRAEELLDFAVQRIHERTGEPFQTIKDAARQLWSSRKRRDEPELRRLYPIFGELDDSGLTQDLSEYLGKHGFTLKETESGPGDSMDQAGMPRKVELSSGEGSASPRGPDPKNEQKQKEHVTGQEFLTCSDLAIKYKVNGEALRKRLERWMPAHQDDWKEVTNRGPREAKYLYRASAVVHIIKDLPASGETSG